MTILEVEISLVLDALSELNLEEMAGAVREEFLEAAETIIEELTNQRIGGHNGN